MGEGGEQWGREGSNGGRRGAMGEGGEQWGREGSNGGRRGAMGEGGEQWGREGSNGGGRGAMENLPQTIRSVMHTYILSALVVYTGYVSHNFPYRQKPLATQLSMHCTFV